MTTHYSTLGVSKDATSEEIKKAYRKLASKHHPDKGGNTATFQRLQEAYSTLSDPEKKAAYDNPSLNRSFHHAAGNQAFDDLFTMFRQQQHARQQQARLVLNISLADVVRGGKHTVGIQTLHGTSNIEIEIPPGLHSGENIQYPKLAPGGMDLIITFQIVMPDDWQRDGFNLFTKHRVSIWDLIVGGETTVTDILGNKFKLAIPPKTQPSSVMRLKNKGMPNRRGPPGDLLIGLSAEIPDHIPDDLLALIGKYKSA